MSVASVILASLLLAIPATLALAAIICGLPATRLALSEGQRWRVAWGAVQLVAVLVGALVILSLQHLNAPLLWLSDDPLRLTLLVLLSVMALVLVHFSRRYMAADPGFGRYFRWLLFTLAAVSLVFVSNHLLIFWLAWVAISLALHQLLMFYPERPRAALAAHKKFILARLAELSLLAAFLLLWHHHGNAGISNIINAYQQPLPLSFNEQLAAVLLALTALIKCAQLPVHGWLIKVVEAPTPVSALLHAGVINLGGFLLLLFSPLFLQVAAAQWLVLVVAGLTTLLAALIMATRISVKVRLAWSTSAQMGLMLMQCALGLVELALLHLLAHSGYKAWAFLSSGSAVREHLQQSMLRSKTPGAKEWSVATLIAALLMLVGIGLTSLLISTPQPLSSWLLLGMAMTVLLAQPSEYQGWMRPLMLALLLVLAYGLLKALMQSLTADLNPVLRPQPLSAADLWAGVVFIGLFASWWVLRHCGHWPVVQRISVALFAGLYLDEWFTRMTLKIWPARIPERIHAKQPPLSLSRPTVTLKSRKELPL